MTRLPSDGAFPHSSQHNLYTGLSVLEYFMAHAPPLPKQLVDQFLLELGTDNSYPELQAAFAINEAAWRGAYAKWMILELNEEDGL